MASLKDQVKSLQKQGPAIATHMYDNFFTAHTELKQYFSVCFLGKSAHGDGQQITLMAKVMAHILFQFILNLDKADNFKTDLERIAAKHASRGIKPEFFPYLGDALMLAIKDTLGDKSTDEVLKEWRKGYDKMAETLISQQKDIEKTMSWLGMKKFKIVELKEEKVDLGSSSSSSEDDGDDVVIQMTTKVHLAPEDGSALPTFKPGQYVCVKIDLPETGVTHRNYVLCNKPGDATWVLDMKHEGSGSIVSTHVRNNCKVGDIIEMSAPAGSFLLLESLST